MDVRRGLGSFTRAIPGACESEIAHLNDQGLPKVGALLKAGDILVGRLSERGTDICRRVTAEDAEDASWSVIDATLDTKGATASITLRHTHALEVGDIIVDTTGRQMTVGCITPLLECDLLWVNRDEEIKVSHIHRPDAR